MKFEIFTNWGNWYWRLRAANRKIVADGSEAYSNKSNVKRAVRRLNAKFATPLPVVEL